MLGFQTIGNATLIAFDGTPILATDPWLEGGTYFGSWSLSHEVPAAQIDHVRKCPYLWISHGHPDHLQMQSLQELSKSEILLPDHVGRRIETDLRLLGFKVRTLPERQWVRLSPNIQIMSISDYYQDAILLVDINGRLVINMNDAMDRGWSRFLKRIISAYPKNFFLKLFGWGDVDMNNFFDEEGRRITTLKKRSIQDQIRFWATLYGVKNVIPFSSFHTYQRNDSVWANEFVPPLSEFETASPTAGYELLPAFISYDCEKDSLTRLNPRELTPGVIDSREFGDDWGEALDRKDQALVQNYFQSLHALRDSFDFIKLKVGGKETHIRLNSHQEKRGITFESPRGSFMKSVKEEIFDDMLISNFMKTTLHGLDVSEFHPGFTPWVGKYADNGRAKTHEELRDYFRQYRRRAPVEYLLHAVARESERKFRAFIDRDSKLFDLSKKIYLSVYGK